jgi:late competence protein required for DNA uptake (superfamily II DNA/RNA helicase)
MVQAKRYESLDQFKSGQAKIIVCSDVAARGIDIDDITHVFNYDVPNNRKITCTASVVQVAQASPAMPSRWFPSMTTNCWMRSKS